MSLSMKYSMYISAKRKFVQTVCLFLLQHCP